MSPAHRTRLVGVFAHPDDDVFTIGGTLALHAADVAPTLVFCTSGEAGPIWVDGIATRDTLSGVREREQKEATTVLGVDAETVFLHRPAMEIERRRTPTAGAGEAPGTDAA